MPYSTLWSDTRFPSISYSVSKVSAILASASRQESWSYDMSFSVSSMHSPAVQPLSRRFMLSTSIWRCSEGLAVRGNFSLPSTVFRNFHSVALSRLLENTAV